MYEDLIQKIAELLGDEFPVITAYDETENVDENGTFSVDITETEFLHHGTLNDARLGISINAQTLIDADKKRQKIFSMANHLREIDFQQLVEVDGVAGVVVQSLNLSSDGESNLIQFQMDVFVCGE